MSDPFERAVAFPPPVLGRDVRSATTRMRSMKTAAPIFRVPLSSGRISWLALRLAKANQAIKQGTSRQVNEHRGACYEIEVIRHGSPDQDGCRCC